MNGEWVIRLYQTQAGGVPFSDWFENLKDDKTRFIVDARLSRLRLGNFGDCKALGGGLHELRIDFGPGLRIYFGRAGQRLVILLCAGDKSTQRRDIQKAKEFWTTFKGARNENR